MRHSVYIVFALCSALLEAQAQVSTTPTPTVSFLASLEHASMVGGLRLAREQGTVSSAQAECLSRQPSSVFQDAMSHFYESSLAPNEQRDADAFFSSSFGQQLSSSFVQAVAQGKPIPMDSLLAASAKAENSDAAAFLESSAGDKILIQGLFRRGETRQEVVKVVRAATERCR